MCSGQIRGGRIKIKSPAGQKCMSRGQLFWPRGDYFGPRAKDDKAYSIKSDF